MSGHGVLVVRAWCISGMGMVCQWYGHGVLVVRAWCVSGIHVAYVSTSFLLEVGVSFTSTSTKYGRFQQVEDCVRG